MKILWKMKYFSSLMVSLGAVGCGLRRLLYILTEDGKGLVRVGHPLEWGLWALFAAALILALLGARNMDTDKPLTGLSRTAGAVGCVALAIGIGLTALLSSSTPQGFLGLAWKVLGVMCFASLDVAAKQRWDGKQPWFLLSAVVCVFFALHMVSSYRGWSGNPQMMDYVFTLFANIFLMLFAYQQGAVAADCGKPRLTIFFGAMAVFCCLVCLSGTGSPVLYFTGGVWALTNLWIPVPSGEVIEEANRETGGEADDETA